MKRKMLVAVQAVALLVLIVLAACSSKPVNLSELPVYTGAVEHSADKGGIGGTLANNNQIDAAMRNAGGVGGNTEQKGYRLPKETTWDALKRFYDEKLISSGWKGGAGGKAGNMATEIMNVANQNNPLMQTAIWSKGKQTLTIMLMTNPINKTEKDLIFSLSTH